MQKASHPPRRRLAFLSSGDRNILTLATLGQDGPK